MALLLKVLRRISFKLLLRPPSPGVGTGRGCSYPICSSQSPIVIPGNPLALRTRIVAFHFLLQPLPDCRSNSVGLISIPS
jgi:hypothetical protein